MRWLLVPYDKHSDDGFGAMGYAFKASAETLNAAEKDSITHRELPTCFLLRHAAELFLKSALIVSHRVLVASAEPYPLIRVGDKQKSLTSTHSLGLLYRGLIDLLTQHRAELKTRAKTDWLSTPPELDEAIARIDDMDRRGVFFRYPTEDNSTKSSNRPLPIEDIEGWSAEKRGALKAFVVVDQDDNVIEAFRYTPDLLKSELETLTTACDWLNGLHLGLRQELAGGW